MNRAALAAELAGDPAGLGYAPALAAGDHGAVAGLLNARTRAGKRAVEAKAIRRWMILNGVWAAVRAKARAGDATAETVIDALDAFADFDFADPAVLGAATAMLDGLVAGGVLSVAQKAAVLALGDGLVSRAEELFGEGATARHENVSAALAAGV